jgi:hypothetical protein
MSQQFCYKDSIDFQKAQHQRCKLIRKMYKYSAPGAFWFDIANQTKPAQMRPLRR